MMDEDDFGLIYGILFIVFNIIIILMNSEMKIPDTLFDFVVFFLCIEVIANVAAVIFTVLIGGLIIIIGD